MKILVVDIGGTNIKVASSDIRVPVKIPGPVVHDHPLAEPHNLAAGWIDFNYQKAFGKPLRFINDAAMQALGGYRGGRMLFLGIGTGLGSAMIFDGVVIPLELAHLPYKKGRTYEEYVGLAGLERRGDERWQKSVLDIIKRLQAALICDSVLLGGGNAKLMKNLPSHVILGSNSNAIDGGIKLWQDVSGPATTLGTPAKNTKPPAKPR